MTKTPSKTLRLLCAVVLALGIAMPSAVAFGAPADEAAGEVTATVAADEATGSVAPLETTSLEGAGTEDDPYLISSPADLLFVAEQVNTGTQLYRGEFLKLTGDINLANDRTTESWTPIGTLNAADNTFQGTFDGKGHSISGLYINSTLSAAFYGGLFGHIRGATLKDFVVKGSITSTTTNISSSYIGGAVGYAGTSVSEPFVGSTILNVGSEVTINVDRTTTNAATITSVGGVVGFSNGQSSDSSIFNTVRFCYNKSTLTNTTSFTGGIAGRASCTDVTGCYNTGNITINVHATIVKELSVGGIAGNRTNSGTMDACYTTGIATVSEGGAATTRNIGAVVGNNAIQGITNSFYLSESSTDDGIDGTTPKTDAQFKSSEFLTELNAGTEETTNYYIYEEGSYPKLYWEVPQVTNIEDTFTIEGLNSQVYTYTGSEVIPEGITVTDGDTVLSAGDDYSIEYANNLNAGRATITITGQGNHEGTLQEYFTINPAPLTITAVAKQKPLGNNDPALTYQVSGLKAGDSISSVTLTRTPGETAGSYDITATGAVILNGNLNATANYAITYVKGTFTINSPEKVAWPRLDGNKGENGNRFDTMQAIVTEGWTHSDTVIVAYSHDFPDALAASSLAGIYDSPVILTEKETLTSQARDTIGALDATKVLIIGGEAVVSNEVADSLKALEGITEVKRIAGEDRFNTALDIYREGRESTGGWSDTAIIANGFNFADALSVSPFANATRSPIFLSTPTSRANPGLDTATLTALTEGGFKKVIITGGTAAVPALVEDQLASTGVTIERWSGDTRYETSVDIVKNSLANSNGALSLNNLVCATGDNYPDALAGGAFAGHTGTVLLLVHSTETGGLSGLDLISEHKDEIGKGYVLGGAAAVPQELLTRLQEGAK